MKKLALLILICIVSNSGFSQEEKEEKYPQDFEKNYELKINAFNLIAFTSLDVSFEKLLSNDKSFGVSLFYNFADIENTDVFLERKFSLTPYYRWFFSESRYARGFFVEGFGMLNTQHDYFYNNSNNFTIDYRTNFALGVSVGGKFVVKSGFTAEVLLGIGRNIISGKSESDYFIENDIVGRFAISMGYRF